MCDCGGELHLAFASSAARLPGEARLRAAKVRPWKHAIRRLWVQLPASKKIWDMQYPKKHLNMYYLLHEMYKLNICNKSLLTIMMINSFKFIVISYFVKDTNLRRVYTGATWHHLKGDAFTLEQPLANLKHATWSYTAKLPTTTTEFACC